MANFPNKIFSLKESSLFYMLEIKAEFNLQMQQNSD